MKPMGVLAAIDAQIAHARDVLEHLMSAREHAAKALGVDIAPAETAAAEPRRGPARRGGRPKKTSKNSSPVGRRAAPNEPTDQVMAWLGDQDEPVAIADVVAGTQLSKYHVKNAIKLLVNRGELDTAGIKSHYRLGLPKVMAAAAKEEP